MKVEREKKFTPVVITVESQDELNYLWHCLNVSVDTIMSNSDLAVPFPKQGKGNMWDKLDKIVRP